MPRKKGQLENEEAGSDPPSSEDSSLSREEQEALEDRGEESEASSMSVQRERKRRAAIDDDTLLEKLRATEASTASAAPSKFRRQVNRAEETEAYLSMPHDDEVYEADDEFLYE